MITTPSPDVLLQPVVIPATTPRRYVSFNWALNLREPGEDTGDWHFNAMFFWRSDQAPRSVNLAGEGTTVDSTVALARQGIRDMALQLARHKVLPLNGPVYVANHYRAIADLALLELLQERTPRIAAVCVINQWLDTKDQVVTLVQDYLGPLGAQLRGPSREVHAAWLPTIQYD